MLNNTELQTALQDHLHWNRARITFIVAFVIALMKVTTVNLNKVANALGGTAHKQSNYRRIQRFFSGFVFDYSAWAKMVLRLVPVEADFVISIDRTNWRFGRFEINILMAGLVYQGTAWSTRARPTPWSGCSWPRPVTPTPANAPNSSSACSVCCRPRRSKPSWPTVNSLESSGLQPLTTTACPTTFAYARMPG